MSYVARGSNPVPGALVQGCTTCVTPSLLIACLAGTVKGVDAQSCLPYLATYLGHKDIYSTLVYLTITQELLQQASERFRVVGARVLKATEGGVSCA